MRYSHGLSLVETVIVVGILSLLMTSLVIGIISFYRSQRFVLEQALAINEARRGVKTMMKEIREARPGDDGSYPLALADDQEIIFFSNIDQDSAVERVRYFLDGSLLKKGVIKPTGSPPRYQTQDEEIFILSKYVRNQENPIFTYFNENWPSDQEALPTPSRLRETKLIQLYLLINVNPQSLPKSFELSSNSQIRNLKTNL